MSKTGIFLRIFQTQLSKLMTRQIMHAALIGNCVPIYVSLSLTMRLISLKRLNRIEQTSCIIRIISSLNFVPSDKRSRILKDYPRSSYFSIFMRLIKTILHKQRNTWVKNLGKKRWYFSFFFCTMSLNVSRQRDSCVQNYCRFFSKRRVDSDYVS